MLMPGTPTVATGAVPGGPLVNVAENAEVFALSSPGPPWNVKLVSIMTPIQYDVLLVSPTGLTKEDSLGFVALTPRITRPVPTNVPGTPASSV